MYRRHRYYDPQTGQFTQEDPLGLAGGLNAYGFANGDPINFTDPFGLCPIEKDGVPCTLVFGAAGTAAGFTAGLTAGVVTTAGTLGVGAPIGVAEVGTATVLGGAAGALIGAAVDTRDAVVQAASSLGDKIKRGAIRAAQAVAIAMQLKGGELKPLKPKREDEPPPPPPVSTKSFTPSDSGTVHNEL